MDAKTGIYRWTSPSGKSYIGQASNLSKRKREFELNPYTYNYTGENTKIDRARRKYNNFSEWKYDILEYCDELQLNERETYYINLFDTYNNGYNSSLGGDGNRGYKQSEETKKKHSVAMIGRFKGEKSPLYKINLTDEHKAKISESKKGENHPLFGKHLSNEHKSNISKGLSGRLLSEEHKTNISRGRVNLESVSKGVLQFTKDNILINKFPSIREAERQTNISNTHISLVCRGIRKSAGGYIWKYE